MVRGIRVLIIDDQRVFAEALISRLDDEEDMSVVGAAESGVVALSTIDLRSPDVVIVDFELREEDPEKLIVDLRKRYPSLPLVVVTDRQDPLTVRAAVKAGARAFVPKGASVAELVDAVRGVTEGESRIPPELLTSVLQLLDEEEPETLASPLDRLTPRELEVLREMVAGRDRSMIATELKLSVNTVRTHIKHILPKLEVHSSLEAVAVALRAGLRPR